MVRGALGEADQEFEAAVYRATGGNPLLIRTLAGALAAAGVEPRSAQADRVESVGIDRIGRIVLPRMHRLGADAVAFARAAALLGEGVDARVVAALAGMDYSGARAAADALVVAEILRRDGSLGFVHPLVRAAVVEELPPGARAGLHRRAAEHLYSVGAGAEDVARHLLACDPVGEDWALTSLRAAGRLAVERGAPEAAVIVLEHALREPFVGDARAGLLHELGSAGFHSRHPSALRWLESALACAEDASLWMTVVFDWVAFAIFTGTKRPPVPIAQAPELGPEQRLGLAVLNMIDYGYTDASSRSTGTRSAVPTEQLRGETYLERMWLAAEALDAVMRCDRAEHAIELADGLLAHERFLAETSDNWPSSWVFMALMWSGKLERTLPLWQGAVEDAVRHGSLVAHEWARMGLGLLHLAAGRLVDAETEIVAAMELDTGNFVIGRPWKLSVYVEVLREGGAHREAEEALEEHGWLRENPPRHAWGSRLLESRGRLHLAAGRPSEGLADFRACGENMAGFGRPHSAAYAWRAGAAVCLSALGERDEAMRLAAEQVADARSFGAAPWLGSSLLALGTVTGGAEGIALLREAVEVLASSEARLEHAHALCDLGVLLRHERQVMESREPLRQALDLAERCGARALAERATQELRLAGARPRRRAITGAESLTAAERRVAVLAAQGKSNPEVAQSLFVTRKTVEKHLGSAFLKLQITSRAELPAALSVDV